MTVVRCSDGRTELGSHNFVYNIVYSWRAKATACYWTRGEFTGVCRLCFVTLLSRALVSVERHEWLIFNEIDLYTGRYDMCGEFRVSLLAECRSSFVV